MRDPMWVKSAQITRRDANAKGIRRLEESLELYAMEIQGATYYTSTSLRMQMSLGSGQQLAPASQQCVPGVAKRKRKMLVLKTDATYLNDREGYVVVLPCLEMPRARRGMIRPRKFRTLGREETL